MTFPPYNTIFSQEHIAVDNAMGSPLSGYLGGELKGGQQVERLEAEWQEVFDVEHAIACNSATSGLLMACLAAGVGPSSNVVTTPYTMSATAAAPAFLGAHIEFRDIGPSTFTMPPWPGNERPLDVVIVTNLFGHPARLDAWRNICDMEQAVLIEDNAQAPFATENGRYAGTIGHIGVFSLNVHKHFQCGEGGICVTNDQELALRMRMARNHGEMAGHPAGLNLRMTEVTAAIALEQLGRGKKLVQERVEIAEAIIDGIKDIPFVRTPVVRKHCTHVYYCIPFILDNWIDRHWFAASLKTEGIPIRAGYLRPLYELPAFSKFRAKCSITEDAEKRMLLYENCAWTPTSAHIKQMHDAFHKVADHAQTLQAHAHSQG